LRDVPLRYA